MFIHHLECIYRLHIGIHIPESNSPGASCVAVSDPIGDRRGERDEVILCLPSDDSIAKESPKNRNDLVL